MRARQRRSRRGWRRSTNRRRRTARPARPERAAVTSASMCSRHPPIRSPRVHHRRRRMVSTQSYGSGEQRALREAEIRTVRVQPRPERGGELGRAAEERVEREHAAVEEVVVVLGGEADAARAPGASAGTPGGRCARRAPWRPRRGAPAGRAREVASELGDRRGRRAVGEAPRRGGAAPPGTYRSAYRTARGPWRTRPRASTAASAAPT